MSKSPTIGIDLGTSYCCVGVFENGFVQIIPNDRGNRKIPTLVCFNDSERFIGDEAEDKLTQNSVHAVYETKRFIGRKYEDELLQEDMKHWPFDVTNVDGKTKIAVDFMGGKKQFFPEEVTSMILSKMKETAESYLKQEVTNAVITVPAYFNDSQRQATKDAAEIAGLKVLKIINDSTAAAITYKMNSLVNGLKERKILIFDFGGGTFDASIVKLKNKKITVKSTGGNTHLGGVDIDNRLVNHFVEEFRQKHEDDISQNQKSLAKLRVCAEDAKRTLSACSSASIDVDSIFEGKDFHSSLTRFQLNDLCDDLFQSTLNHVKHAMKTAQLGPNDIDEVVLVGGSSRIPRIQNLLQALFEGKILNKTINLDEAVANGAAIQAAILNGQTSRKFNGLCIKDVYPFSIEFRNHLIFPRNCQLPIQKSIKMFPGKIKRPSRHSQVCEKISENEQNILQQIKFNSGAKGIVKFKLTFSIDINGIFSPNAKSEDNVGDIQFVDQRCLLSREQIKMLVEQNENYKLQVEKKNEKMDRIIRLEELCYDMKKKAENFRGKIPDVKIGEVIEACNETIAWAKQNEEVELEEMEEKEKNVRISCHLIYQYSDVNPQSIELAGNVRENDNDNDLHHRCDSLSSSSPHS